MGKREISTTNKAFHGNKLLYFYPISGGEFETPIQNRGMRAFSKEIEQAITKFFADNDVWLSIAGTKTISGEVTAYYLEKDVYTELLGYIEQSNGGFADTGTNKPFGLAYAAEMIDNEGNTGFKVFCMYNATATEPSEETTTDEDEVELTELVFAFEGSRSTFVVDDLGNKVGTFFIELPNSTEAEVQAILAAGMPLPTDTFVTKVPATGVVTVDTPTSDVELSGTYDYTSNDDSASESKLAIYETADLSSEIDNVSPLTNGTGTAYSFVGLTANTAYTIKLMQGTNELASTNATTLETSG